VFFLHGTRDRTVPAWMSQDLFDTAREPKKIWLVEGADHLGLSAKTGTAYEENIVTFFDDALTPSSR